jgi:photosystem II stability/assembly factor-like uncharacterized protein
VSPVEYDAVAEGQHSFVARAIDPAGNRDSSPVVVELEVDRTAPTTIVDPVADDGLPERDIAFHSEDPEASFDCALDRNMFHPCSSPVHLTRLDDGNHIFWIHAHDLAGNLEQPDVGARFVVDTTGPGIRIVTGPPALSTQASASFKLAADETPVTFECSLDGGAFASCSAPATVTVIDDRSHTFEAVAIDRYGNRSQTPASFSWTTDAFPPLVSFVSAPPAITHQRDVTLVYEANKPGCTLQCSLDGGPLLDCSGTSSLSGLADGSHVFSALATDAQGRAGSAAEARWTLDTAAPTVSFRTAPPALSNVVPARFELEASEPGCSFECELDSGGFAACASSFSLSVGEGAHRLSARAVDPAGNVGTAVDRDFTIDQTSPAPPAIDQPDPSLVSNSTPTLSWSPSDSAVSYRVELSTTEDFSQVVGSAEGSSLFFVPSPLVSGRYFFRARARDAAGNDSPWSSSGIVEVRSWAFLNPQPTGVTLHDVACADEQRCWIVGEAGTAIRTEDGGATFLQASTGVTGALFALQMLDESTGVTVGADGAIVRTSDGGITWRPVASGTRSDLYALRFSGDVGFAAGDNGMVLRSADRGLTWSRQSTRTTASLRDLAILDAAAHTLVAVGGSGTIIRSVDGGLAWTEEDSGVTYQLRALSFVDAQIGFAVGEHGVMRKTTDAGLSWGSVETGNTQGLYGARFASAAVGYTLGDSTTSYASIRKTADGGLTWSNVVAAPGASMRAMATAGASGLVAVGEGGTVLISTDGGASFVKAAGCIGGPTQTADQDLRALQMLTPQVGYVFGGRGFAMRTDDGGATLVPLAPAVFTQTKELYAASFWSATAGWVGGDSSFLARTSDGQTFTTVAMPTGVSFFVRGISFVDADNGLIVGTQGKALVWGPGASLREVPSPTTSSLRAVKLTSSSSGRNGLPGDDI